MMMLTIRAFTGFVLAASGAVLGTALLSQYWGGLAPCELCLLQRWPWAVAITVSITALFVGQRSALSWVALMLALAFITSSGLAFYHLGVEQRWFAGPSACTARITGATTLEELRRQIINAQPVRCDEVQWSLFGISLAGLNLLASLSMTAICAFVFRRTLRASSGEPVPGGAA